MAGDENGQAGEPPIDFGAVPPRGTEPLSSPDVGLKVIRGGTVRLAGYGVGMVLTGAASVLLLRHLGVADFGRFMTVISLVAIVAGLTDAGLTAVAGRDLALRGPGELRKPLVANLIGLRLVLTPMGVLAATAFAVVADYDHTLVIGTVLAGIGLIVSSYQSTMTIPLSVDLRIAKLTAIEIVKHAAMFLGIALLVVGGAGLMSFFALSIVVALATLAVTRPLVGKEFIWRPAFDRDEWRTLVHEALPLAAAVVVGIFYFRLLVVLMSLRSSEIETGFFATSFRISEILYSVATLVVTVALPVLAVAAQERSRLRYMLQRMIEVSMIAACYFIVVVVIAAEPILDLLGGSQYRDAAPVLRIQVFALVPVFLAQVLVVGLISIRRPSLQVIANTLAVPILLALGLVLIPAYGAKGAAIAALVAETAYGLLLLALLVRYDPSLSPNFRFMWKALVASALAAVPAFVPRLPHLAAAMSATLFYLLALWLTRAMPREVLDAFAFRNRSSRRR